MKKHSLLKTVLLIAIFVRVLVLLTYPVGHVLKIEMQHNFQQDVACSLMLIMLWQVNSTK